MSLPRLAVYRPLVFLVLIGLCIFTAQAESIPTQQNSSLQPKQVRLAVYSQPMGGNPLWEESQSAVPDEQGLYRVLMGAEHSQGVPSGFASGTEGRWLGVQIEGEEEQPRVLLASLKPLAISIENGAKAKEGSGPVLYQILFRSNATPGHIPKISPTFTLTNSLISEGNNFVAIGNLSIASDGTITFAPGQTFPNSGVQTVTAGNAFITVGGTVSNPTVGLNSASTDARYLQLTGGTLTGLLNANGGVAGTTGNFSGALTAGGGALFPATGTATSGAGFNSNTLDLSASAFNGSSATNQTFRFVTKPVNNNTVNASGILSLQFGGGVTPGDTGLSIASNGLITFAPGQIFPGFVNNVTAGNGIIVTGPATNPVVSLNTSSNITGTISADFFKGDGRFLTNVNANTANFASNAGSLNGLSGSTFARNDVPNDVISGAIPPGHSGALNGNQIINAGNLTLNGGNASITGNVNATGSGGFGGNLTVGSGPNTVVLNAGTGSLSASGSGGFGGLLTEAGGSLRPAQGTATSGSGFNSNVSDYAASVFNSTASAAQNQTFRWQAEPIGNNTATPSASLNLLFGANGATPAEANFKLGSDGTLNVGAGAPGSATGMKINGPDGFITFNANQVFPGSVTSVTSGNDVSLGAVNKSIFVDNTNPNTPVIEFNTANADLRYVTLATPQTISGAKTLTSLLAANGGLTATTGTFSGVLAANGGLTGTTASLSSTGNFAGDLTVGPLGTPKITFSASNGNGAFGGNLGVTGSTSLTGALSGSTAAFTGNLGVGANITATAGTGNVTATSFTGDGSTLANVNATQLGGVLAANYARLDIGNSFTGNQNVTGNVAASGSGTFGTTLNVTGASSLGGLLTEAGGSLRPAKGTATSGAGFNSTAADYTASVFNSTASSAQNQTFRWQAEPVGNNTGSASASLNLLFGANGAAPSEANFKLGSDGTLNVGAGAAGSTTGMKINGPDGVITFNSNQVFPGSVTTVTAADSSITVDNSTPTQPKISVSPLGIITAKLADQSVTTNKIADANVTNVKLQNSSVTINTAGGLTGGGIVSLGGTLNLGVDNTIIATLAGNNTFTGNDSFTQTLAANGGITSTTGKFTGNVTVGPIATPTITLTASNGNAAFGGNLSVTGTSGLTGTVTVGTGVNTITANASNGNLAANSFTGDGSTLINVNATQLGGVVAANYARLDIGNSFTGNQGITGNVTASGNGSFGGTLAVTGNSTLTGALAANGGLSSTTGSFGGLLTGAGGESLPATGTATAGSGADSNVLDLTASSFNSGNTTAENQTFRWLTKAAANDSASPSGTLDLQFSGTSNGFTPTDTGFSVNHLGIVTFAAGQSFPGSVTSVTAGDTSITIGGTASAPTVAVATSGITTGKILDANVTNAKLANSSVTINTGSGLTGGGLLSLGGTLNLGIDNTVVATLSGNNAFTGNNSFSQSLAANGGITGSTASFTSTGNFAGDLTVGPVGTPKVTLSASTGNGSLGGNLSVTGTSALTGTLTVGTGVNTITANASTGNVNAVSFSGIGTNITGVSASDSAKLGGVVAANYARNDVANDGGGGNSAAFTGNQVIKTGGNLTLNGGNVTLTSGNLSVTGTGSISGTVSTGALTVTGGATVSTGNLGVSAGDVNVTGNANPTGAVTTQIVNEGTTGTTQFKLAKLTGAPSTAILATTSDSTGLIGIVISASGITGNATIAQIGQAQCVFDGATVAGHYVISSNATSGDCHDAGANYPTVLGTASSVQVLGRVLASGAGGSTPVVLFGPEQHNTAVTDINGNQTINPHIVTGSASTTAATSVAVTFSGAAAFSSNTSFFCTANDTTATTAVQISYTNGGNGITLTLPAAATDTIRFQCTGN
jgi:hypothetical protein